MKTYQTRPHKIKAFQYTDDVEELVSATATNRAYVSRDRLNPSVYYIRQYYNNGLVGRMRPEDWFVVLPNQTLAIYSPDDFNALYEESTASD